MSDVTCDQARNVETVKKLQKFLRDRRCYSSAIDGAVDNVLKTALRRYASAVWSTGDERLNEPEVRAVLLDAANGVVRQQLYGVLSERDVFREVECDSASLAAPPAKAKERPVQSRAKIVLALRANRDQLKSIVDTRWRR